jgi:hypothetical protein
MILFDALLDLAFVLQDFVRATATSGSNTTLVDTAGRSEPEDFFDNGTLFIIDGSAANNAPVISAWNGTTKTFTFGDVGAAVAATDAYAAIPKDFPKGVMLEAINHVLKDIKLPATDETLVTVSLQEEYALPAGVYDVKGVEIGHSTTTPYLFVPHQNWREREGNLVFDTNFAPATNDDIIRLLYNDPAALVTDDSDTIDDQIDRNYLKWSAAVDALRWRMIRNPEEVGGRINEALAQQGLYRALKPKRLKKTPRLSRW